MVTGREEREIDLHDAKQRPCIRNLCVSNSSPQQLSLAKPPEHAFLQPSGRFDYTWSHSNRSHRGRAPHRALYRPPPTKFYDPTEQSQEVCLGEAFQPPITQPADRNHQENVKLCEDGHTCCIALLVLHSLIETPQSDSCLLVTMTKSWTYRFLLLTALCLCVLATPVATLESSALVARASIAAGRGGTSSGERDGGVDDGESSHGGHPSHGDSPNSRFACR